MDEAATDPVDALLVVSFGGPEKPDDVMPFLRNVTWGRNVPEERLEKIAEHYLQFGGRSPINDQNRALISALEKRLAADGPHLPIYWGNRNWHPMLSDTVAKMASDGIRHAAAFVTSAYSSYSSCRQYREDIAGALEGLAGDAPRIHKLRQFFNHSGFVEPFVDSTHRALHSLPEAVREDTALVFTAHSIPTEMAENSRYEAQLQEASALVAQRVGGDRRVDLVYQSRSGSPRTPWLEPDVNDHLRKLAADGFTSAVLIPIGFVSDHMEVVYDLDIEAQETAAELNLHVARAETPGTDDRFVAMIAELVSEHIATDPVRQALGSMGAVGCQGPQCCLPPAG